MYPDATQLRDIHDITGAPWWPLAPGWWLVLAGLAGLGVLIWLFRATWRLRIPIPLVTLGNWRWDAGRELRRLRQQVGEATIKQQAADLSELLRRIAMARHGRPACAGRNGTDWLDWLTAHDPKGFDWRAEGRLLLDAPYAPPREADPRRDEMLRLIDAVQDWVTAKTPPPRSAPRNRRWIDVLRRRPSPTLSTKEA